MAAPRVSISASRFRNRSACPHPIGAWRHPFSVLERAVERAEGAEASIKRYREDWHFALVWVAERGFDFGKAIAIEEGGKIAVA